MSDEPNRAERRALKRRGRKRLIENYRKRGEAIDSEIARLQADIDAARKKSA